MRVTFEQFGEVKKEAMKENYGFACPREIISDCLRAAGQEGECRQIYLNILREPLELEPGKWGCSRERTLYRVTFKKRGFPNGDLSMCVHTRRKQEVKKALKTAAVRTLSCQMGGECPLKVPREGKCGGSTLPASNDSQDPQWSCLPKAVLMLPHKGILELIKKKKGPENPKKGVIPGYGKTKK